MKIAICDDNISFIDQMTEYLKKYSEEYLQEIQIKKFTRADAVLEYLHDNSIDILLLDLIFTKEEINGIDVAKRIRETNPKMKIIFLSVEEQYALQGYSVDASGYFVKPIVYSELVEKLEKISAEIKQIKGFAEKTDKGYFFFEYSDVVYIDTEKRKTCIHTLKGRYIISKTMKELGKQLDDKHFFRTHASYIVNFQYIKAIDGWDIIMKNQERVMISKYKKKEFMDCFMQYLDEFLVL